MTTSRPTVTDGDIIDDIALLMASQDSWSADTLDDIAGLVGMVRPHPGDADLDSYRRALARARAAREPLEPAVPRCATRSRGGRQRIR